MVAMLRFNVWSLNCASNQSDAQSVLRGNELWAWLLFSLKWPTFKNFRTSGQDGGVGRHAVPPRTTKRRTTTNLKTKSNQNWQEIKLYGSPTTKEIKKKHSSRPVGGVEPGSRAERTRGKAAVGRPARQLLVEQAVPCSSADKPGGTTGEQDRPHNPGFQWGEIKPQPLSENTCGGWGGSRRNSQPHRWVRWRDPQGPRTYTNLPTWESVPEEPNLLVESGGSDWKPAESRASAIVTSRTPPLHTMSQRNHSGCPALVNT